MRDFMVKDRRYLMDEESLICLSPDDVAVEGFHQWEKSGRLISSSDLMKQLLSMGFDDRSVREFNAELQELQDILVNPPETISPPHFLRSIELHIAHSCNLGCKYCFAGQGDYGTSRILMDEDVSYRAVDLLVEASKSEEMLSVIFFGGEPLVNKYLIEKVIEYTKERHGGRDFTFSITTNGTLIDEEFSLLVQENKFNVMVSMDGVGDTQDKLRPYKDGRGTSSDIEKNVKKLSDQIPISVRSTITQENIRLFELCVELGRIGFARVRCAPVSSDDSDLRLDADSVNELKEELIKLADDFFERAVNGERQLFYGFNDAMALVNRGQRCETGCGAGRRFVAVTPEGDMYPCHRYVGMTAYRMGNIDEGLAPITDSRFWSEIVSNRKDCRDCWIRNYCGGGCIWEASDADGVISTASDPMQCEYRRIVYEIAIDLLWRLENSPIIRERMESKTKV